jgi:asparagine synthase (glutamine-hydrolysing)
VKKYWELPNLNTSLINNKSDEEIKQGLNDLLLDSVNKQMIADVPVGVLLSGGVDSSLITAYASMSSSNVKTFTVTFPDNKKFDESHHAKLISSYFKTSHTEIEGTSLQPDLLRTLAWQYDEPMIDSSMLPTYIVTNLISKYCKVAIGGDGGDELFGGYGHYSRLLQMAGKFDKFPSILKNITSKIAKNVLPIGFKGRIWLQSLSEDFKSGLPLIATLFESQYRKSLMSNGYHWPLVAEELRNSRIPKNSSLLERATRMDFNNYLPEDILVKVDRASMLNSLELRAPFLDFRIIEYAFSNIPNRLKASTTKRKYILKQIAKDILPKEFDFERKQGFGVPLGDWIKDGEWRDFFEDILFNGNHIFDKKIMHQIYKSHLNGNENTERLFSLVMFELWRREYKVSF